MNFIVAQKLMKWFNTSDQLDQKEMKESLEEIMALAQELLDTLD